MVYRTSLFYFRSPVPGEGLSLSSLLAVASPRGGDKRGNLPPPPRQLPIGHTVRSMQIRGDFRVRKNRGRFTGFSPTFLHAPTLRRTFFGLTIKKKEGVVEVVEGVTLVGPQ